MLSAGRSALWGFVIGPVPFSPAGQLDFAFKISLLVSEKEPDVPVPVLVIKVFLLNPLVSPPILSRQGPFIYAPEGVRSNM